MNKKIIFVVIGLSLLVLPVFLTAHEEYFDEKEHAASVRCAYAEVQRRAQHRLEARYALDTKQCELRKIVLKIRKSISCWCNPVSDDLRALLIRKQQLLNEIAELELFLGVGQFAP